MTDQLSHLARMAAKGRMTRREFNSRAAALGVSAAVASSVFATAARAEEPKKGGLLRAGMQGGESTNTLDPALAASEVPFAVNMLWGEMLVDVNAKGEIDVYKRQVAGHGYAAVRVDMRGNGDSDGLMADEYTCLLYTSRCV